MPQSFIHNYRPGSTIVSICCTTAHSKSAAEMAVRAKMRPHLVETGASTQLLHHGQIYYGLKYPAALIVCKEQLELWLA